MEEYLQHMRALRSQMNDVEDQAAKVSVEEQMLIASIRTTENDIQSVNSETKLLKDKIDEMEKAKGQACSQITEKQRKIASLESDSSTLIQTLELIQQEAVSLSAKHVEKSTYYSKVAEDMNAKIHEQQDWFNFRMLCKDAGGSQVAKNTFERQTTPTTGMTPKSCVTYFAEGKGNAENNLFGESWAQNPTMKLESTKAKLCNVLEMRCKLEMEMNQMEESSKQIKSRIHNFNSELRTLGLNALEEEYKALLPDKVAETECFCSLQKQIDKLKGISQLIKCGCGEEYMVQTGSRSQGNTVVQANSIL